MKYDEIEIERNGDQLTITFKKNGKKIVSYYYDVEDGNKLSLTKLSGIMGSSTTDS